MLKASNWYVRFAQCRRDALQRCDLRLSTRSNYGARLMVR